MGFLIFPFNMLRFYNSNGKYQEISIIGNIVLDIGAADFFVMSYDTSLSIVDTP